MIHLDGVGLPAEGLEDVVDDLEDLRIRNHCVVSTGDVEIALVELSHAPLCHGRLVTTVDLCDLVALEALNTGVHGEPSRERDCQIVAQ